MTKLFDKEIKDVLNLISGLECAEFGFDRNNIAKEGSANELILKRDMAYELGEGSFPATSITAITLDESLVPADGVYVIGKDLDKIKSDGPFARITLIRTDDVYEHGDQAAYNLIKSLETQKFRVFPSGYMVRASAMNNREQVRVSKSAIKDGISFASVGNMLIESYKKNPRVKAVGVYFITLADAPYRELDGLSDKINVIVKTLNHALKDVSMDCKACEWKPVCDTVDGMKELHGKVRKGGLNGK